METMAAVKVDDSQSKSSKILRPRILISQMPEYDIVTAVNPSPEISITNNTALKRWSFNLSINKFVRASKMEMVEVMVASVKSR